MVALKIDRTPYTYILEWTKQNKRYIGVRWASGCHPSDLWSEYFTSSSYVREFTQLYGNPDIILVDQIFTTPQEAMERERFLLKQYNVPFNKDFLNKGVQGFYDPDDPDIRKRMSEAQRTKKISPESLASLRDKVRKFHTGRVRSEQGCENISKALKGKPKSPEHAAKCRVANANMVVSQETREKHRRRMLGNKICLGRKKSLAERCAMSANRAGINSYWYGKHQDQASCLSCRRTGGVITMQRWHFENCKEFSKGD